MRHCSLFILFLVFLIPSIQSGTAVSNPETIPLWVNGAPGFEGLKNEKEQSKDWWVKNIHYPTITAFFPKEGSDNGTAVLIFPGGGHRELVFDAEGVDAAKFFNQLGITAFVLKYRLAREPNSPYTLPDHPQQDAYRAMRTIRYNAKKWGLDKNKIGVMGFSAGGEVAAFVAYGSGKFIGKNGDTIDKLNGKPNFQILIYPGPMGLPNSVEKNAPSTFVLAAMDDPCCAKTGIHLLQLYANAKLPIEAHFYTQGGHGFNMGYRAKDKSIAGWPQRLADWLIDSKLTKAN